MASCIVILGASQQALRPPYGSIISLCYQILLLTFLWFVLSSVHRSGTYCYSNIEFIVNVVGIVTNDIVVVVIVVIVAVVTV